MVEFRRAAGRRVRFMTSFSNTNPDTKAIIRTAENHHSVWAGVSRHARVYEMRQEVGCFIFLNCLNATVALQQRQLSQSSADKVFDSLGEALQATAAASDADADAVGRRCERDTGGALRGTLCCPWTEIRAENRSQILLGTCLASSVSSLPCSTDTFTQCILVVGRWGIEGGCSVRQHMLN